MSNPPGQAPRILVARSLLVLLVVPLAVLALLASTTACGSVGVGGGDGLNLLSVDQEWAMRDDLRRQVAQKYRVLDDRSATAYLNRIGREIAGRTALGNRRWDFGLVDDPKVNAFNLPGGLVYVNAGLVREADRLDQLTGVLAHEVGHGVARHGTEMMTRAYGLELLASIALGRDPSQGEQVLAQVVGTGVLNNYSRAAEREADELGVRFTHAAGFDPRGMPDFFRKLQARRQRDPNAVERFFSSHPVDAERIADTEALIGALPAKRSLVRDSPEFQKFRSRLR
jgi:predicted Zn-dependent protease